MGLERLKVLGQDRTDTKMGMRHQSGGTEGRGDRHLASEPWAGEQLCTEVACSELSPPASLCKPVSLLHTGPCLTVPISVVSLTLVTIAATCSIKPPRIRTPAVVRNAWPRNNASTYRCSRFK